ncbi:MAG: DeoR family transcriptional regulator [Clostridia bacterium]|nr:DeoR family transcriptional regulator [Clostridia bacterium]
MTERRAALLKTLCRRRHETVSNLAVEFGVSERTIRRDIEILGLTEPIYTQPGRYGGGVYVTENYYMDRIYLGKPEIELLIKILQNTQLNQPYILTNEDVSIMQKIITDYAKPPKRKK